MLSQLHKKILSACARSSLAAVTITRGRFGLRRTVIGEFKNENEYKKSLEPKPKKIPKKRKPKKVEQKFEKESEELSIYDQISPELKNLKYHNPNPANIGSFSRIMQNMKSRAFRERNESCLLEGKFLIADAMKTGMFVRTVYFSRLQNLEGLPLDILKKTNLVKISFPEIQDASEVKVQSEGLLAIATKQDDVTRKKIIKARNELMNEDTGLILPLTLICDNVRDGGNMGTILRSAAGAGCHQVLLTNGCVDMWDPKCIRAGAGAHFKIPIVAELSWEDVSRHVDGLDVRKVLLSHHNPDDLRISDVLPDLEVPEESELYKKLTSSMGIERDSDVTKEDFSGIFLKSAPYYDVTYINKGHTVLVIGGEVQGVSAHACLFAVDAMTRKSLRGKGHGYGDLVNIPMSVGSECLNTSIAGSIILFEARKQMLCNEKLNMKK